MSLSVNTIFYDSNPPLYQIFTTFVWFFLFWNTKLVESYSRQNDFLLRGFTNYVRLYVMFNTSKPNSCIGYIIITAIQINFNTSIEIFL